MDPKKLMKILIASFSAICAILVAIIVIQFVSINKLKSERNDLNNRLQHLEQQIEDIEAQLPTE